MAGLVIVGPVYTGPAPRGGARLWDGLAEGLRRGGVEGFVERIEAAGIDPEWRDTVLRITRQRISCTTTPKRWRRPFARCRAGRDDRELETLEVPALVVASHDVADPSHAYAVAEAYAESLPAARLIGEGARRVAARLAGRQASHREIAWLLPARDGGRWPPS